MLLFHTKDPTYPEQGTWWELPGGGLEPGETYREAAVRDLPLPGAAAGQQRGDRRGPAGDARTGRGR
ncbi:NUDIX domain-containing protein [Micromonospora sp. CPCC 206060]